MKMKSIATSIYLCILFLILTVPQAGCQNTGQEDTTKTKLMTAGMEIMTSANTCGLITIDEEGLSRVRTMDPFPPENDFTVWFGTNSMSRKVEEIKKNNRVTLYYTDPDDSGYVTIHGTAQLIDDPIEKEQRWKKEWEAFYPDKTNGYLLIKVSPIWMEVLSPPRGIFGDDKTWLPPRVVFDK
jgi:general stress protein 26